MGCSNSHLRPLFRRCRRRRSKKEEVVVTNTNTLSPKTGDHHHLINENDDPSDLLQGVTLLGASLRHQQQNNSITSLPMSTFKSPSSSLTENSNLQSSSLDSSAFCVPLLAQSEASASQLDFFRMLDAKIEEGPDYEDEDEGNPGKPRNHFSLNPLRSLSDQNKKSTIIVSHVSRDRVQKYGKWSTWDEDGD